MTILYRYLEESAVQSLWDCTLMASTVQDFNDPFECLPAFPPYMSPQVWGGANEEEGKARYMQESRDYIADIAGRYSERWFVIALSQAKNNLRMWSQYAGNHTGFMLGLDIDKAPLLKGFLMDVDYYSPRADAWDAQMRGDHTGALKAALRNKGFNWRQEQEVRLILPAETFDGFAEDQRAHPLGTPLGKLGILNGRLKGFVALPPEAIKSITLGYRSGPALEMFVRRAKSFHGRTWRIAKVRPHSTAFALVEDELGADVSLPDSPVELSEEAELDLMGHHIALEAAKERFARTFPVVNGSEWHDLARSLPGADPLKGKMALTYLHKRLLIEPHATNNWAKLREHPQRTD